MASSISITGTPSITIDGRDVAPDQSRDLIEMRVSRTSGAAAFCEMKFDRSVGLPGVQVGVAVQIGAVEDDGQTANIFDGEIVSVGIDMSMRQDQLVIGAYDPSYKLGNQIDSTSHLNVTFADLIAKIASSAGLSADVDSALQSMSFEHVQQTGTPHQFLSDLTRSFGCEWFVADGKLTVRRRSGAASVATFSGASSLRRFSARFSGAEQASSVDVRGWDPAQKSFVNSKVQSSGTRTGSEVPITSRGVKGKFSGKDVVAAPKSVSSATDAKAVAEGITGRLESAKLTGRGEVFVDSKLVPGATITIQDVDPNWNGRYYLTGVEHLFGRSQPFITRFTFGALEPTTLVDMFGHQPPNTRERLTSGIAIGEVTDTKDPAGLLRVKVTLPVLSGDNVSHWARIVSPGAGPDRGAMAIPEVGDEVAVAFENGDAQRPYVLGGLWNGKHKAPDFPDLIKNGAVMGRSITSREGHDLTFSDGDRPEDLFVKIGTADRKAFLVVGHTMIELTNDKKPIKISNSKGTVEIAENGDISVTGEKITVTAKGDLTLSGSNVKIDARQKVTIAGNGGADLTSNGPVKVQSSAITEIKGSMVKLN